MSKEALWQRYQDWLYFNEDLGLYLDVSRMRFGDELIKTLMRRRMVLFQECHD